MEWISELSEKLQTGHLPGVKAHEELAAFKYKLQPAPDTHKKAGVMGLLFPAERGWSICFIQRPTRNPNDPHSGQISFPGGRMEESDENIWQTAIRETEEEIGVPSPSIQKIGSLSSLYIPVSDFLVFPYIGYTKETPQFTLQESEVSGIITPPVKHLLEDGVIKFKDLTVRNNIQLKSVPHFYLDDYVIWGATAMMLNEFRLTLLRLNSNIE